MKAARALLLPMRTPLSATSLTAGGGAGEGRGGGGAGEGRGEERAGLRSPTLPRLQRHRGARDLRRNEEHSGSPPPTPRRRVDPAAFDPGPQTEDRASTPTRVRLQSPRLRHRR
ncbi:unnamed protein product [Lampetra fluviatilis]